MATNRDLRHVSHERLDEWLGSRQSKRVGSNKVVYRDGDGNIHLMLHTTPVVTFHPNGDVSVRHGGYPTRTTAATIKNATGLPVSTAGGQFEVARRVLGSSDKARIPADEIAMWRQSHDPVAAAALEDMLKERDVIKLARLGKENLYFPPSVRKRDFYKFLTQIDPRNTGGGNSYVHPGSHTDAGVFADWLDEHGDWRAPIAREAVAYHTAASSMYAHYPEYVTKGGKRYESASQLTGPEGDHQYGFGDYLTAPVPKPNVYGTDSFAERRGGRWGHADTSRLSFRLALPAGYAHTPRGETKPDRPAIHVSWTHRVPMTENRAAGQTHASATIHAIMQPEQLLEMARNAPTESIRQHLYHALDQFKQHTGWKIPDHMKLARATTEIGTTQHQKRLEIARQILKQAGLSPAVVRAALAQGDRAGVVQVILKRVHPELAKYVAAWFGLLSGERTQTVFHPSEGGSDTLHVITTAHPADQVAGVLKDSGAQGYSVEPRGGGSRVYLFNSNNEFDVGPVLRTLGDAKHTSIPGTGTRVGNPESDAAARDSYRNTIRDFENGSNPPAE